MTRFRGAWGLAARRAWVAGLWLSGLLHALPAAAHPQLGPLPPLGIVQGEGVVRPVPAGASQLPPAPLPFVAVTQLDDRQLHPELDGERISLTLADPTPIIDILRVMVADTSLSLIPAPALDQTFIGELKTVTRREALDLMLEPLGLDYSIRGNIIRVFPRELETRLYSIDHVITQRAGSRGTGGGGIGAGGGVAAGLGGVGVGGALAPGGTVSGIGGGVAGGGTGGGIGGATASVGGSDAPDFFGELEEGVRNLLSADGTMSVDRTAGVLQVTDRPSRLDRIGQYLDAVMLRVSRQVQIEARVIEVELNEEHSAGINWNRVFSALGGSLTLGQTLGGSASGGFTMSFAGGDTSVLLDAFAQQGRVNVLSSPRVTAMNNQPAVMNIGTQRVFFTTTTQVGEQGQILQTTVTPQSVTEGVILSVTPQISADGIIHMSINPSVTENAGFATSRLGDLVPQLRVRQTDSLVRVRDGETIVIAGLMQDRVSATTSKVPVIGDVPVVGSLFRRSSTTKQKTDLVILLTPRIMGPAQVPDHTAREIRRIDSARQAAEKRR